MIYGISKEKLEEQKKHVVLTPGALLDCLDPLEDNPEKPDKAQESHMHYCGCHCHCYGNCTIAHEVGEKPCQHCQEETKCYCTDLGKAGLSSNSADYCEHHKPPKPSPTTMEDDPV